MAKNDPLLANMNLGQRTPRREEMLKLPCRLVVIAVDEMDGLASEPIAICRHAIVLAETEISEEIKRVLWFHEGIQSIQNHLIHLSRICEGAIAVSDDVEVSKVKVGRKPSVSHDDDYAGMSAALFVRTAGSPRQWRKLFIARSHRCRINAATASAKGSAISNPGSVAMIVSACSGTRRFTIGFASPASSASSSKFFGVTFSDEYSPHIHARP